MTTPSDNIFDDVAPISTFGPRMTWLYDCLRIRKFEPRSKQRLPVFEDGAACALWNSGDHKSWLLYPNEGYLVQQDGEGIVPVKLNRNGTVEPRYDHDLRQAL